MTEPTPQQILDLALPDNPSGANTVRGYLIALLTGIWQDFEFGAKRPFGHSDWQYDLYIPLMKAGFITGQLDEDGYVEKMDDVAGDRLILAAIKHLSEAS